MPRLILMLTLLLISSSALPASAPHYDLEPYPFLHSADAVRFQELTNQIRCVVCQFQTIADSDATIAADLRQRVYTMVLEKKSDQEIKDFLVKRYGEVILLKPRLNTLTLVLWLAPFLLLFIAAYYIRRLLHQASDIAFPTKT